MFRHSCGRECGASERNDLADALRGCRTALGGIALFSAMSNVLMLTGAIFMLQIYDRVLASRSVPTLFGLAILAAILFVFLGLLEIIRARLLVRVGSHLDDKLSSRVFGMALDLSRRTPKVGDGLQAHRDLDQVRRFLASGGPAAFFDLPWILLYLGLCFAFHTWLGMTVLCGALFLVGLTVAAEYAVRGPLLEAARLGEIRQALALSGQRSAAAVLAMGMAPRLAARWQSMNDLYAAANRRANDLAGALATVSRIIRMMLQSGVLAVGAYLVIRQEATGGIIIASAILASRALAPVELVIGHWQSFICARQSWHRLKVALALSPKAAAHLDLPAPEKYLSVERVSVVPPGASMPSVQDATFRLERGQGLGIIGPAASGKTSLTRAIVGVWAPARGDVRIDGATLTQWDAAALGRHIGYLPQEIELFAGTINENIGRFDPEADSKDVIAAALAAGVHDLVLRLPQGYATQVGESGAALSAGQRQRIALARALYKNPFLIVLDEPNSNLDAEGDAALTRAVISARKRGAIVIVVAHRPSALEGIDQVLVMAEGRIHSNGPKDKVLRSVLHGGSAPLVAHRAALGG